MADLFIDVPVEVDEQTLADRAVDRLRINWLDWTPNEGDMEVVQIETLAPMAAEAARAASQMPSAAFRAILAKLHGVPLLQGTPAIGTATFGIRDTAPHVIPAGTEIDVDGFAFAVNADTPTAALSVAAVPITATLDGVAANALVGDVVTPVTSLAFVTGVTLDGPTGGGTDPETSAAHENRGSRELELQAKTLVTTRDYELMSLSFPGIGRATAISDPVSRSVVVYVATAVGGLVTNPVKIALQAMLDEYRLSTWVVFVQDPTRTTINVTYTVHLYPGAIGADVIARANAALAQWLDPAAWGRPRQSGDVASTRWYNEPRVRKNKIIDLLGDVEGVDYVGDVTISASGTPGGIGTVQPNGDWLMPGTVPLAVPGTMAGSLV